jgi:hypothetical protein
MPITKPHDINYNKHNCNKNIILIVLFLNSIDILSFMKVNCNETRSLSLNLKKPKPKERGGARGEDCPLYINKNFPNIRTAHCQ